ncbi:MAG: 1-deoxy-D-xylulose-5-phosphate reductoisomerase [Alphaproteobacteria bacterium]|nr:1-deoxy-D-xylulose-5-phosphate reductoisomerase [Alphaproteobacteria bacterium]
MSSRKKITILGATGSVGRAAQDIIKSAPERFDVQVVTAGTNAKSLAQAAKQLDARKAVIADENKLAELKELLSDTNIETAAGTNAISECAGEPADLVLAAIVGLAGLRPILNALEAGINIAVANKEPLVAAGQLVTELAKKTGAKILPVDSEHNAIFQVFEEQNRAEIEKIILTASGGPFRESTKEQMAKATPAEALAHPNWTMGRKISIDSATMVNKALEVIEAHYLFNMPAEKIEVLIHPQSIVHSMVSYTDGSVLAQMGASDMRTPVTYALGWPERMEGCGDKLDFTKIKSLTFSAPDLDKFPSLSYAYEALEKGQAACITLNAANEVAVDAFLNEKISFPQITECIRYALDNIPRASHSEKELGIEDIEALDRTVRDLTTRYIAQCSHLLYEEKAG